MKTKIEEKREEYLSVLKELSYFNKRYDDEFDRYKNKESFYTFEFHTSSIPKALINIFKFLSNNTDSITLDLESCNDDLWKFVITINDGVA